MENLGRLCYVTQVYHPEALPPVPTIIPETLHALGWDVRVVTAVPNYPTGIVPPGYHAHRASREVIDGIPVRRTPIYPSHDGRAARRILTYTSWALSSTVFGLRDIRSAGLALVYSSPVTANLAPMVARILFGTPYVQMIEDLWPDSVFDSNFLNHPAIRRVAWAVVGAFASWSYRLAAHVTVLSPSMRAEVIRRGCPPERVSLVYNWVDETLDRPGATPDPSLRGDLGLTADDFVLMYAGAHGPAQQLDIIIRAVASLPPSERVHLVTFGDGISSPDLAALVDDLGVGDCVHLLGRRPKALMPGLQAAADLQLVSIKDTALWRMNMPSKVQSLLACAFPILVVGCGDPADVVTGAGAGFAAVPDVAAVADAVLRARRAGSAMLRSMGDRGRELYLTTMAAEIGGRRLTEILGAARRGGGRTR